MRSAGNFLVNLRRQIHSVVIAIIFLLGVLFYPVLSLPRAWRTVFLFVLGMGIIWAIVTVLAEGRFQRWVAGIGGIWILSKLYDSHYATEKFGQLRFLTFLAFLFNPFTLVQRKLRDERTPSPRENAARIVRGGITIAVGVILMRALWSVDLTSWPFLLEHCVKSIVFLLVIIGFLGVAVALWRLGGGKARDVMNAPALARTPADFWRRYNRVMGQFLYEDIYNRAAMRRGSLPATLLVFTVSAVLHEALFTIAIGQMHGFQLAFFLVQGLAVVATQGCRPRGWQASIWTAGTLTFNLLSSILFFASINQVLPFYSRNVRLPWGD